MHCMKCGAGLTHHPCACSLMPPHAAGVAKRAQDIAAVLALFWGQPAVIEGAEPDAVAAAAEAAAAAADAVAAAGGPSRVPCVQQQSWEVRHLLGTHIQRFSRLPHTCIYLQLCSTSTPLSATEL